MKKRRKPKAAAPTAPRRAIPGYAGPLLLAVGVVIFYWIPLTSAQASIQWDAADMHYPLQKYFSDRLLTGQFPFWTPYLFSGYPFLANPEVAAWYPLHWPFFLAGITPRAIQMEIVLNAILACLGAYFLIRRHINGRTAAVFGAMAYGLSGFFAGHASHIGLFAAACWFPWLLLAYRCASDSGALRYVALGALAGGAMILAGYVQTAMYGFLGLGLYAIADLRAQRRDWVRIPGLVLAMLAGALAVAAIQILPGLELARLSVRAASRFTSDTAGILHLAPLMTLIAPNWLGAIFGHYTGPFDITQYYFYSGFMLLPLAAIGAMKTQLRFPALLLIVPTAWYLCGPPGGFYRLGALVPGLQSVRAPIQGWFIISMGLALVAAGGADWILARGKSRYLKVALVAVLFADVWYWNSFRNPLAYARASFQELYGAREEIGREHVLPALPPLTRFDAPRDLAVLGPLDHPLDLRLESTYGYFALEPAAYDEYAATMERNSKLRDGLNVSRILNVHTGGLDANTSVLPRAYFPKAIVDVRNETESRNALASLNPDKESTVLAPHPPIRQDPSAAATVVSYEEQAYRIRYHAASASLLKLSTAWYPGWHATLDGRNLPVLRVDYALMGVVVPPGDHEVQFRFSSNYFAAGLGITLVTLLGLTVLAKAGGRRKVF